MRQTDQPLCTREGRDSWSVVTKSTVHSTHWLLKIPLLDAARASSGTAYAARRPGLSVPEDVRAPQIARYNKRDRFRLSPVPTTALTLPADDYTHLLCSGSESTVGTAHPFQTGHPKPTVKWNYPPPPFCLIQMPGVLHQGQQGALGTPTRFISH